jgi:histone-lysine N-methyltransferase SETD8
MKALRISKVRLQNDEHYFQPSRIPESQLNKMREMKIVQCIRENEQDGLIVNSTTDGRGQGLFAAKTFHKGDYVIEYRGDVLTPKRAQQRDRELDKEKRTSGYFFDFADPTDKEKKRMLTIDPTPYPNHLAQYINHSNKAKCINCKPRAVLVDDHPHVVLIATADIRPGDEIIFNYDPQWAQHATKEMKEMWPWHMKRPQKQNEDVEIEDDSDADDSQ